ncbi:hypothetical protein HDF11_000494 [Tunturiibacter psychrotolerans]
MSSEPQAKGAGQKEKLRFRVGGPFSFELNWSRRVSGFPKETLVKTGAIKHAVHSEALQLGRICPDEGLYVTEPLSTSGMIAGTVPFSQSQR